jgi:hypothetical protein
LFIFYENALTTFLTKNESFCPDFHNKCNTVDGVTGAAVSIAEIVIGTQLLDLDGLKQSNYWSRPADVDPIAGALVAGRTFTLSVRQLQSTPTGKCSGLTVC